ncbi:MAG: winged helix-turn-helix transcriptional regulator [Thermogemmatispora sp.]|uniref:ArsR/SmtB family transcription factor n=1 Tax=Thermogemmatispora sp. TaxID=1968838 RepID=UPI002631B9A2|nr:metalloregulator ArsR/SmtB family transcription factor [Thermogemmatispora sp.]MBX5457355.1 winged helix-turn-helix transcriptional regulator [Thermogemmatispora sp.]
MCARRSEGSSSEEPLEELPEDVEAFIDYFLGTMCDPSRRQILALLAAPAVERERPVEMRSGEIAKALGLAHATVSGHLRQLARTGLLGSRRSGNEVYYSVRNHLLVRAFHDLVEALSKEHQERFKGKLGTSEDDRSA